METDIRNAITILAQALMSALPDIGRLKAEQAALLRALQGTSPELPEALEAERLTDGYLSILNAASFQLVTLSGLLGKPRS